MAKSVAFTFGRFNPPTIGHEKLMDKTRGANKNYRVYASQSQDPKRNPLNHRTKVAVMKGMFPAHARKIKRDKMTTAIDVMVKLYKEKHTDVLMVVGSDRVGEFDKLLNKYNGKKATHGFYKFKSIRVISAGERDPDAEGVSGMSASKMRKAAQDNDFKSFQKGLPRGFKQGKLLFKTLQKEMGVKAFREWVEIDEGGLTHDGPGVAPNLHLKPKVVFHPLKKKKDKGPKPSDQMLPHDKATRIEGFRDRIYRKEYQAAHKLYQDIIKKRRLKPGDALHKAASSFRHVTDRGLKDFISNK